MQLNDGIVKWVRLLKSETFEELEERSKFLGEELSKQFVDEVKRLSNDEHILELYNKELEEEEIREYCREQGFQEGTFETQKQVVLNMLKLKYDFDTISKVTGLTHEEFVTIINSL